MSDSVLITGIIVGGLLLATFIIAGSIFAFNTLDHYKRYWKWGKG